MSGELFSTDIALRWGDMDAMSHVNNAATVTLLEEARIRFITQVGAALVAQRNLGVILARHEIDYTRPIVYSLTPVRASCWIDRIGTSSFTVGCELSHDGQVAVKARTVLVVLTGEGTPRPVPDDVRAMMARFLPAQD
jgi:acyl-CoA thioester hydrolase